MPKVFLRNYLDNLQALFGRIDLSACGRFIVLLEQAFQNEKGVFIFGNGGSGSIASHFACDMNKGVSYGRKKRFRVYCLNDNVPTMMAYANDTSYDDMFVEQLKNFLSANDLIIGMSGSGNSDNFLAAVAYTNENSAVTFGISGTSGELEKRCLSYLVVDSGDKQKIEDMFSILLHCTMQRFSMNCK